MTPKEKAMAHVASRLFHEARYSEAEALRVVNKYQNLIDPEESVGINTELVHTANENWRAPAYKQTPKDLHTWPSDEAIDYWLGVNGIVKPKKVRGAFARSGRKVGVARSTGRVPARTHYTKEELDYFEQQDKEADARWQEERSRRELEELSEKAARAELNRKYGYDKQNAIPAPRGKITVYKGWEIEKDPGGKGGYILHYQEGHGGKFFDTLKAAKTYVDNY